ncbi:uncharacterized protein LOC126745208 isoform X2 [Anthonomus grandis grandis]|uniref:uncharacterized protein LOC126745208 isoform X2 n=1 Tax=Anthonomus grandis grandis TaxID=2921223 RepID=UPI002166A9E4|nr:uncharacterized protein LOC126745208 isoform X2 [Anthonomus grandis grandis]
MFSLTLCLALVVLCYPAGAAYGHYHPRLIVDSNDRSDSVTIYRAAKNLLDNLQNHKDGNDNTNGDSHIFWKSSRNNRFPNYLRNGFWKKRVPSQRKSKTIDDLLPWHPLPPPPPVYEPPSSPILTKDIRWMLNELRALMQIVIQTLLETARQSTPKYVFDSLVPGKLRDLLDK